MQSLLRIFYPPQCVSCDVPTEVDFALCGTCWSQTRFIEGLVCDLCGDPLPGEDDGHVVHCDRCIAAKRPWVKGRAAMLYKDNARRLVLAMKYGDRPDLAKAAGPWLARAAGPLTEGAPVIVPIPIHRTRLLKRRYNQSAELARVLAAHLNLRHIPDALKRLRRTLPHDGMSVDERYSNMKGAIVPHPTKGSQLKGQKVILLDDVMTSGATFDAATQACLATGADQVCVLSLARVNRDA